MTDEGAGYDRWQPKVFLGDQERQWLYVWLDREGIGLPGAGEAVAAHTGDEKVVPCQRCEGRCWLLQATREGAGPSSWQIGSFHWSHLPLRLKRPPAPKCGFLRSHFPFPDPSGPACSVDGSEKAGGALRPPCRWVCFLVLGGGVLRVSRSGWNLPHGSVGLLGGGAEELCTRAHWP